MIRRLRPRSLRWQLILASLAVEAVLVLALTWNGFRLVEDGLAEQVEIRLKETSVLLNASLGPLMASQDYGPIADLFRESRSQEGIAYFVLTDSRGRVVLSDGWDLSRPLPPPRAFADTAHLGERFDTRMPITLSGQTYGQLALGISTRFIAQAQGRLVRESLAIAAVTLVLSGLLLTLVAFWLTRHLKRLENASAAVSAGHFDIDLPTGSQDEIGRVATAFKRMAAEIKGQFAALQSSEERFRNLLSLSTDWYWEQDADFRFTIHQPGRLGDPEGIRLSNHLLGKRRWEQETTLGEAEWAAHRADLAAHRVFRDLEYGVRDDQGNLRHFQVCGEPVFDFQGNFRGYRGTSTEITERKRAENSLRLAASVFAEAREGIIITDGERRVVDINPMVTELTGFTRADLLGCDVLAHVGQTRDRRFLQEAMGALDREGHWRGESWGLRKNGETFPELVTASAVHDAAGAVSNYILIFSDITALKEQQRRLEHLAHYDALTRLPNRVLLADRLQQAMAQCRRSGDILAVAYMDLDGFKPINDSLGHDAGDLVLIEVAALLLKCVRGGDTVARLGGDEFVILIRAEDFGECEAALLRVLTTIAEPYAIKGRTEALSASIGVARFPADGDDPDALLRNADQAMYVAKQTGRNRYHFFDTEHDRKVRAHSEQVSRIRAALPADEFVLYYQPKVDMRRGVVVGAEALIRWRYPERGLLPPSEFLPAIENTDFAITLGEWVIATALAQMGAWRDVGVELPVSVNVAARQLLAPGFVERLQALLAARPEVPPPWLELEIVETAALDDIEYVTDVINRCAAFGVSFALDDFGTGYSSLIYFKRLPARTLKIDQSFVRDMLVDPEDLAIIEGIIGLARAFHREVIAEGVETAEHGARLLALGCDTAQGYGIARPMPAGDVPAWTRAFRPDPRWLAPA